jgi:hypothetical protein
MVLLGITLAFTAGWCLRPQTVEQAVQRAEPTKAVAANPPGPPLGPTTPTIASTSPPVAVPPAIATSLPTSVASRTPDARSAAILQPTSTPQPLPTPQPTRTSTPVATPTPASTATLVIEPGRPFYQADFAKWAVSGPWQVQDGVLFNDGTNPNMDILATDALPAHDYHLEAKLFPMGDPKVRPVCLGLVFRGEQKDQNKGELVAHVCNGHASILPLNAGEVSNPVNFNLTNQWYTFEVDVKRDHSSLSIDHKLIFEADNAQFLFGTKVGFWGSYTPFKVSEFSVTVN